VQRSKTDLAYPDQGEQPGSLTMCRRSRRRRALLGLTGGVDFLTRAPVAEGPRLLSERPTEAPWGNAGGSGTSNRTEVPGGSDCLCDMRNWKP